MDRLKAALALVIILTTAVAIVDYYWIAEIQGYSNVKIQSETEISQQEADILQKLGVA